MDKQSRANHISALKKLRDDHRSQLDEGVLSQLNVLIEELEKSPKSILNRADAALLASRVLEVVAQAVKLLTNISDWLR